MPELPNGVLIHDNFEVDGPTAVGKPEQPGPQPFMLQDHDPNSKLKFRNIWLQPTANARTPKSRALRGIYWLAIDLRYSVA